MLFPLNHQIYFCKHDERTVFHPRAWPDCLLSARASAPVWRGGGPADQDSGRPGDRATRLPLAGGVRVYLSIYPTLAGWAQGISIYRVSHITGPTLFLLFSRVLEHIQRNIAIG